MGTRADFYIGSGPNAKWLGSIAWDGYEFSLKPDHPIMNCSDEESFRTAVEQELVSREDGTLPVQGWPWPWETSRTTDYVYWFENGATHYENSEEKIWPDMRNIQNVDFGKRSGILIVGD